MPAFIKKHRASLKKGCLWGAGALILTHVCLFSFIGVYYRLPLSDICIQSARIAGSLALSIWYDCDRQNVQHIVSQYYINEEERDRSEKRIGRGQEFQDGDILEVLSFSPPSFAVPREIPFIYEDPDTDALTRFAMVYGLADKISDLNSEFEKMVRISAWVGSLWDHGSDELPGEPKGFNLERVITAGQSGGRFWCEIAAEVSVRTASSLGWPARMVTLSRNGYQWEHAVAEYWSNQYRKWFVVDTDFNLIYFKDDVPLSAFELCHQGGTLQRTKRLKILKFAKAKKSLPFKDLIPYYRYIHIDMRNDWNSRKLRRGSPVGGDLSTWWSSRDDMDPVFTVKKRVDSQARFDWNINVAEIRPDPFEYKDGAWTVEFSFSGYSPFFEQWLVCVDHQAWVHLSGHRVLLKLVPGDHSIRVKMGLKKNNFGPETGIVFRLKQP